MGKVILQEADTKKPHSWNQSACRVGGDRGLHLYIFSEYSVKLKPVLRVATMPVDGGT